MRFLGWQITKMLMYIMSIFSPKRRQNITFITKKYEKKMISFSVFWENFSFWLVLLQNSTKIQIPHLKVNYFKKIQESISQNKLKIIATVNLPNVGQYWDISVDISI